MITPKVISLQEIKLAQTKTKITDMVAVRHPLSSEDYRTTLIILCEDGSLRMFLAAKEKTGDYLVLSFYKLLMLISYNTLTLIKKLKILLTYTSYMLHISLSSNNIHFFVLC